MCFRSVRFLLVAVFLSLFLPPLAAILTVVYVHGERSVSHGVELYARERLEALATNARGNILQTFFAVESLVNFTARFGGPDMLGTSNEANMSRAIWMGKAITASGRRRPVPASIVGRFVDGTFMQLRWDGPPVLTRVQLCASPQGVFNGTNVPETFPHGCFIAVINETTMLPLPAPSPLHAIAYGLQSRGGVYSAPWNATRDVALSLGKDAVAFPFAAPFVIYRRSANGTPISQTLGGGFIASAFKRPLLAAPGARHIDIAHFIMVNFLDSSRGFLRQQLLSDSSRGFGTNAAGQVVSFSNGPVFQLVTMQESGWRLYPGCTLGNNNTMGCLYNLSTHPPYALLREFLAAPTDSFPNVTTLYSAGDPELHCETATSHFTDSTGEEYFHAAVLLVSPLRQMSNTIHVFTPMSIFRAPTTRSRNVGIAIAACIALLGAGVGVMLVAAASARIELLAEQMDDPLSLKRDDRSRGRGHSWSSSTAGSTDDPPSASGFDLPTMMAGSVAAAAAVEANYGIAARNLLPPAPAAAASEHPSVDAVSGWLAYVHSCLPDFEELYSLQLRFSEFKSQIDGLRGFLPHGGTMFEIAGDSVSGGSGSSSDRGGAGSHDERGLRFHAHHYGNYLLAHHGGPDSMAAQTERPTGGESGASAGARGVQGDGAAIGAAVAAVAATAPSSGESPSRSPRAKKKVQFSTTDLHHHIVERADGMVMHTTEQIPFAPRVFSPTPQLCAAEACFVAAINLCGGALMAYASRGIRVVAAVGGASSTTSGEDAALAAAGGSGAPPREGGSANSGAASWSPVDNLANERAERHGKLLELWRFVAQTLLGVVTNAGGTIVVCRGDHYLVRVHISLKRGSRLSGRFLALIMRAAAVIAEHPLQKPFNVGVCKTVALAVGISFGYVRVVQPDSGDALATAHSASFVGPCFSEAIAIGRYIGSARRVLRYRAQAHEPDPPHAVGFAQVHGEVFSAFPTYIAGYTRTFPAGAAAPQPQTVAGPASESPHESTGDLVATEHCSSVAETTTSRTPQRPSGALILRLLSLRPVTAPSSDNSVISDGVAASPTAGAGGESPQPVGNFIRGRADVE